LQSGAKKSINEVSETEVL